MVARRQRFSQRVRRREYGNVSSPLTLIKTGRDFAFYVVAPTSGVEDYLTGDETRTYWWGQAAAAVGLAGEVQAEALEALLAGVDPQAIAEGRNDGETVAQPNRTTLGWEWSIAPPKSAPTLWAVSDAYTQRQIEEAMQVATDECLVEFELDAGWSRRGPRDARRWASSGLIGARVLQTTSRDNDPQLHEHVVFANLTLGEEDGLWRAIESPRLYDVRPLATTLWGRRFRTEMEARLGVEWGKPNDRGVREIVGVPAELRAHWSKRAKAIAGKKAEWEAEGKTIGAGTAKKASTVTRDLKDETETKAQKIRRWRAEAQQLGFDPDDVAAAALGRVDRAQAGELLEDGQGIGSSWDDTAEAIATAVDERLTDELATWDRIKWVATAAEVAPDWLSGERLHWIADQELADQELGGRVGSRAVRRAATDRRGSPGSERWTTRDNLAMERASLRRVIAAYKAADGARVTEAAALAAAETAELGTEQTGVLVDLAASGRRFGAVVGPAGSGKTRTLQALGQAAEQAGIPIRAMAEAQRAADGLAGGLGVDDEHSENITRFLNHDEADDEGGWWVVDEASMVKTRHWAELTRRAQQTGATIIAVGDPHQLPAVGAGGMFEAFLNHGEVTDHRLGIVWRMREAWERDASLQLRAGDPDAVDDYADRGRVLSLDDFGPVLDEFAQAALDGEEILVTAHSNAAVDQLNDALQARIVGPRDPDTEYVLRWDDDGGQPRERRIGAGDLIRTRKNWWEGRTSRGRAVVNGATWTVTASTPEGLWVESPERGHVLLAPHYLTDRLENGRPTVEHGWAATVHSAQGRTVDRAATIIGPGTGSELLYVGLTRGRSVNLVAGPGTATEVAEMARGAAVRPSRHLPAIAHRPAPSQQPTAPEEPTHMRSTTTQQPTAPTAATDQTDDKTADQARAEREQAEQERRRQAERAAQAEREQAEQERSGKPNGRRRPNGNRPNGNGDGKPSGRRRPNEAEQAEREQAGTATETANGRTERNGLPPSSWSRPWQAWTPKTPEPCWPSSWATADGGGKRRLPCSSSKNGNRRPGNWRSGKPQRPPVGWTACPTGQTPRRSALQQPSGGRPSTPRPWPTPTYRNSRSGQSAGRRR